MRINRCLLKHLFPLAMLLIVGAIASPSFAQGISIDRPVKSRQLDFMVGDWHVEARIRVSPIAFINGSGTMKVHFDKETLLADMKIKFANFEVNGTTKRIFDKAKDRWDVSWNPIGQPTTPDIEGKLVNGRFIEIDFGKDDYDAFIGRLTIFNISNDKFSVRKDQLYDDGTLMKDIWVYEATRIPAKN